jgi:hypothetical protein
MPSVLDSSDSHDYAERSRRQLADNPALAFDGLSRIPCQETRRKLAALIAQSWARQDINAAWNAVARSPLSAIEKQLMFNELWG